ncbi:MAG: 1-acyl-sn-glycerol-3-phosphate acyltransferase [Verrucomicrobia bacterium]|nr:1-acyl-sn-glycerol-3-phosphate acyltransferase [Verrucomicrobiota bacterium]
MDFQARLNREEAQGLLPPKYRKLIEQFYTSYLHAKGYLPGQEDRQTAHLFDLYLRFIEEQCAHPYPFEPVHLKIRTPVDYYQFGLDVMEGIIDRAHSCVLGLKQVDRIEQLLLQGENVVILTNHQAESDPQLVNLLLEKTHPTFAAESFWVAGERVLIDPMAAPFSMGRNLLCVYSKKYIDHPPERRSEKQAHNANTMRQMHKLFSKGGVAVFVAPSGGRDRPNQEGNVLPAPFDASAVEMFRLMASRSPKPVHIFPLALASYNLLPPPSGMPDEGCEPRYTKGGPVHLHFGAEIDMNSLGEAEGGDKRERRQLLAAHAYQLVCQLYSTLPPT